MKKKYWVTIICIIICLILGSSSFLLIYGNPAKRLIAKQFAKMQFYDSEHDKEEYIVEKIKYEFTSHTYIVIVTVPEQQSRRTVGYQFKDNGDIVCVEIN
jgi:hypothetical protein